MQPYIFFLLVLFVGIAVGAYAARNAYEADQDAMSEVNVQLVYELTDSQDEVVRLKAENNLRERECDCETRFQQMIRDERS